MLKNILVPKQYSLAAAFGLDQKQVDPSIMVTGYEIPDPATLDPSIAPHAQFLLTLIPKIDPMYQFRQELIRDIYYWWVSGEDVLMLWGPTGSGKTSVWEQWCARLGIPMATMKGHRDFKDHEAFGQMGLVNSNTVFTPGPMTLAAQYGIPVICNEYDRIPPAKAIGFNDVFEGRPFPVPGNHSQMVTPQLGFRPVITANTNLVEDVSGNYGTASSHDVSLLERIYAMQVGYPERAAEQALLQNVLAVYDDKLLSYWFDQEGMKVKTALGMKTGSAISRAEFIDALIDVAQAIRTQSKDGGNTSDAALERTMSTRILRKWAVHSVRHAKAPEKLGKSGLHIALDKYLASLATESTRIALHQAVEMVFGVGEVVAA